MSRNLEDILNEPRVALSNRAVKLLDGKPTFDDLVREAYQLGHDITRDKVTAELCELNSVIAGLRTALSAKTDVNVKVNVPKSIDWTIIILVLIAIITTFLFLYARPLTNT